MLERTPVSFTHSDRAGLGQGQESAASQRIVKRRLISN